MNSSESFCLQHTGQQDKPLPTVCVVQNEAASHSPSSANYVIQIETSETEAIKELARRFDKPSCLGQYGSYVTMGLPEVVICREDMKIFLQTVKQFADSSTSSLIDQLLLRI
ncbi:MAG: hypothetical protein F6K14_23860 [Symploca sp. SIO2C1]|nr:hypothetical protein [Symploca sp. SIO2C1]